MATTSSIYPASFRLPTLSERHRSFDGCLYASERKNRDEEKQDRELGERVDRLKERMWAIIEMSRMREESSGGEDTSDSDADTTLSISDPPTPQDELRLQ